MVNCCSGPGKKVLGNNSEGMQTIPWPQNLIKEGWVEEGQVKNINFLQIISCSDCNSGFKVLTRVHI